MRLWEKFAMERRSIPTNPARLARDAVIGFVLFMALVIGLSGPNSLNPAPAVAFDSLNSRAVELTAPAGLATENAILSAALRRPVYNMTHLHRLSGLLMLGAGFALMFAFNMAFFRHLVRVQTAARRSFLMDRR